MSDYELTDVLSAPADTFMISVEYLGDHGKCYHIARVFALGMMRCEEPNMSNFIAPIDGQGMPLCEDTIQQETFLVCGSDLAPNGTKWIDIYNSIVPTGYDRRELPPGVYDDQYDREAWNKRVNG